MTDHSLDRLGRALRSSDHERRTAAAEEVCRQASGGSRIAEKLREQADAAIEAEAVRLMAEATERDDFPGGSAAASQAVVQAFEYALTYLGAAHPGTARIVGRVVREWVGYGSYQAGETVLRRMVSALRAAEGGDVSSPGATASALDDLAEACREANRGADGAAILRSSVAMVAHGEGRGTRNHAAALYALGRHLHAIGRADEGDAAFDEVLAMAPSGGVDGIQAFVRRARQALGH